MDVWFEHSVPKVKLNLGRTVVMDVRQMPDERGRAGLVNVHENDWRSRRAR
jgi:hypothetical protein